MPADYCFVPQATVAVAFIGVFVGAAIQGLAYVMVWDTDDTARHTITSHYGLFCLLWTAWTVGLNLLVGWNLTRFSQPENTMNPRQQRTMLQMEFMYITGSILGSWSTWIGIDVMHNRTVLVVSNVFLMCVFMTATWTCWPVKLGVEDSPTEDGHGSYVSPPLLLAVQTV
jgi:cytochrome bd-type quinol oxidase subunit 2